MGIGVFDSGVGGLSVHHRLVDQFPAADFVYLADQANTPYGGRPGEEIVELTRSGCERLFAEGCNLVVLACNTASGIALRRLQQTWLPGYRRELGRPVNVLGIIVPTIEAATGLPWEHEAERRGDKVEKLDILAVFSTPATAASRVYEIEIDKRRQDVAVFSQPCPDLAGLIEQGASREVLAADIASHVTAVTRRIGRSPDRAILGCNTASAIALRRLQQTWLPGYRRELGRAVNVLGIIVPTIEAATGLPWSHEAAPRAINDGLKAEQIDVLGVFSTRATTG
ncbi:hypothetical protein, partial [Phenylobacterium sp.]|uniref:glutamate racemase n=1 Tax=Phenylobacterium sp. TaxID=1871053 RepID=UPI002F40EF14